MVTVGCRRAIEAVNAARSQPINPTSTGRDWSHSDSSGKAGHAPSFFQARDYLADVLDAATELWAGQPKELVPWLEEFVIASKHLEWSTRVRVEHLSAPLGQLHVATRLRLKMEAELWKA